MFRSKAQSKLKINFENKSKISDYNQSSKTTKANSKQDRIFSKDRKPRDTTPSGHNKNGSFYLNFKIFDSTVISDRKNIVDHRKSHDDLAGASMPKLPTIKHNSSKLDTKLSTYASNKNNIIAENETLRSTHANSTAKNDFRFAGKLKYFINKTGEEAGFLEKDSNLAAK